MPHVNPQRVRALASRPDTSGPVLWWIQRDQRLRDTWAGLYAYAQAQQRGVPLIACFTLTPSFPGATLRAYDFMLRGLTELEADLRAHHIPFHLLTGDPGKETARLATELGASLIVTDWNPLRAPRQWREHVATRARCSVHEVDAHNVVPSWIASDKREVGARTLRPKIQRLLPTFLEPFPRIVPHNTPGTSLLDPIDWDAARASLRVDTTVAPVSWITPGERAAHLALQRFVRSRLSGYDAGRNNPAVQHQSDLSPYLHFGHLAPQRVALAVQDAVASGPDQAAYLEELIVRRELSDNFCAYTPGYDTADAFPAWARASLDAHAHDPRPYLYTRSQLEHAQTHDDLWNAAQREMHIRGKMHGYLRMYWAKKILEWSPTYAEALETAQYLNDRYFLDGRDPNGYTGIAWSIGGVHDRPWFDRPIFGVVRYMNRAGCERKFDASAYIAWVDSLDEQA